MFKKSEEGLGRRLLRLRAEAESRGETFYQGPSRGALMSFPPIERWDDWEELDSKAWPERRKRSYTLIPT